MRRTRAGPGSGQPLENRAGSRQVARHAEAPGSRRSPRHRRRGHVRSGRGRMSGMSKAERAELRSVVRSQFKVLRGEVEQRRAEMAAEAAERVRRRFAEDDKKLDDLNWRIEQITDQANKDIRDAVKAVQGASASGTWKWSGGLRAPHVYRHQEDRYALASALNSGIDAQVKGALLNLERREADLLRQLTLGALESEEARAFLATIPAVGDLVPAARLLEIE